MLHFGAKDEALRKTTCFLVYLNVLKSRGWGWGGWGGRPFHLIQCAAGIAPRNTSIGHFADLCRLHWVILNVVSLNSVKYFIF